MVLSLVLRVWTEQTRERGAIPRVLADDLLVVAHGPNHTTIFKNAFNDMFFFLIDIGG